MKKKDAYLQRSKKELSISLNKSLYPLLSVSWLFCFT